MPECKECGENISDIQYLNFKKMCSECVKNKIILKGNSNKCSPVLGIILLFIGVATLLTGFLTMDLQNLSQFTDSVYIFSIGGMLIVSSILLILTSKRI